MSHDYQTISDSVDIRSKLYSIELIRYINLLELLVFWAAQVQYESESRFSCYPFSARDHGHDVNSTFLRVRENIDILKLRDGNVDSYMMGGRFLYDFANRLASWRYKHVRDVWSSEDIFDLIDLSKYEP